MSSTLGEILKESSLVAVLSVRASCFSNGTGVSGHPGGADSCIFRSQKLLVGSAEAKWTRGRSRRGDPEEKTMMVMSVTGASVWATGQETEHPP